MVVEYSCRCYGYNQYHAKNISKKYPFGGPSKDNDKNCNLLMFEEEKSNCMETNITVSNVIAAPLNNS
jgi:hypothetical protein